PVNGNMVEGRLDLLLPSPHGMGLGFESFYNSRSARTGALGPGWTHTYEAHLEPSVHIEGNEYLRIIDAAGDCLYFLESIPGQYKGVGDARGHIARMEDGMIVWRGPDGHRRGFSSNGKLAWLEDLAGNRLDIAYDAYGRPASVTDVVGDRQLAFLYGGDGYLENIQGPATDAAPNGILAAFGRDALGNLTSVVYADGSGVDYTYTNLHDLTEKRDRLGRLLKSWSYDEQNRCIEAFTRDGRGAGVDYADGDQVEATDAYGVVRAYLLETIGGRR
ncbi:MAG: RHS repeat protein, partial [Desulfobacterales bacterium]|nr:RHS repeat protein [Desulfobacterales bacterium]